MLSVSFCLFCVLGWESALHFFIVVVLPSFLIVVVVTMFSLFVFVSLQFLYDSFSILMLCVGILRKCFVFFTIWFVSFVLIILRLPSHLVL